MPKRRQVINRMSLAMASTPEVGISPLTSPKSKGLSAPNPTAPNKRDVKKAFYFTNGDSFGKVRGMINLMRSKVKTKFARKKKKNV